MYVPCDHVHLQRAEPQPWTTQRRDDWMAPTHTDESPLRQGCIEPLHALVVEDPKADGKSRNNFTTIDFCIVLNKII